MEHTHKALNRIGSFVLAIALVLGPVVLNSTTVEAAAPTLSETLTIDTPTNDSTPSWQFHADQAGLIIYYGPCRGDVTHAVADLNNVTFEALANRAYDAGTKYACSIAVVNSDGEFSTKLAVSDFTVDTVAPVVTTVTAVTTPTDDGTPAFVYSSTEVGDVTFGGACGGDDNTAAVGNNTVNLAQTATTNTALESGSYSNCTLTVTDDAGNASNVLAVPAFTVELAADVTLGGLGLVATSPVVVSSRRIQVASDFAGTVTQSGASDGCIVNPTAIPAGGLTFVTVQWIDTTADAYNAGGTDKVCELELTTASGLNTATFDITGALDALGLNGEDAADPAVTGAGSAPVAHANGSTFLFSFSVNEGVAWEVTGAGCSADLAGQTGVAFTGANTIRFESLSDGVYGDAGNECVLTVTDGSGNDADVPIPQFTVDDNSAVTLSDVKVDTISFPGAMVSTDGSVYFSFDANEFVDAGNVALNLVGGCAADADIVSNGGDILDSTLDENFLGLGDGVALADGTYAGCKFRVTDNAGNVSAFADIPTFRVDSTGPVISSVSSNASMGVNPITATFSLNEAATVAVGGGCTVGGETSLSLTSGSHSVTFDALADGAFTCDLTPTDAYGNASAATDIAGTINATGAPSISYAISGLDTDAMTFTFTSSEAGTLTYAGYCSSKTGLEAVAGSNTVQFNFLPQGTVVTNCTITLEDADGTTTSITLPTFTVTGEGLPPVGPAGTVYRFFNKLNGAHLYTISVHERNTVLGLTDEWVYEGMKYTVETEEGTGLVPVYRFWNSENGAHLYTISENEKETIQTTLPKFTFEGVKYFVYEEDDAGIDPVYRFFNSQNGAHLYTISEHEKETVQTTLPHFIFEGTKYYVTPLAN